MGDDDWTMDVERLGLLHRTRFKHLSDEFFEEFLVECKRRRFSPWDKCLFAESYFDEEAGELRLRLSLTLEGFRANAFGTEDYAGTDDVAFRFGDDPRYPAQATVTIYRLVRGQRCPFTRSAYWDECAMYPLSDFAERRPKMFLGYRAMMAAFREGFPDRFGGLWAPEEMTTASGQPKTAKKKPDLSAEPHPPDCRIQLEGEMVAMGYDDGDHRDGVIDRLRETFGELYVSDPQMFWGTAYHALKRNPAQFGPVPVRKLGS